MNEMIMAKYGEIALKGQNKHTFEDILLRNIKRTLKTTGDFSLEKMQSTVYIRGNNIEKAKEKLLRVFGISTVQTAFETEKNFPAIAETVKCLKETLKNVKTFKVEAKRSDKTFHMTSPDLQREVGKVILDTFAHLTVDVHNPEAVITAEIRDNGAYLSGTKLAGAGGLPVGSSGTGLLLLSGGIDSPVAAYLSAKRGLRLEAVHFRSPPYTSRRALMKAEKLREILTEYCGEIKLRAVGFTEIQETLRDNCPSEYVTLLMRRMMIKVANKICRNSNSSAIITGECLGQVASQTLQAINCTDNVAEYPVFRPLIGFDKTEIVALARKIGTFETSILPYEDCCTVFTPKHPKTRANAEDCLKIEQRCDYGSLIEKAYNDAEIL
jgi:thiamine biosynthesis protein ThiI